MLNKILCYNFSISLNTRITYMHELLNHDGLVKITASWLAEDIAQSYFLRLKSSLAWEERAIKIAGKSIMMPRLVAWYGDEGLSYRYSGITHYSDGWQPDLYQLKLQLENFLNAKFNNVLCNYYRNENDSVSWHADNEKELGAAPLIASLSLGAPRNFQMRHKLTREKITIPLHHGDLLVMYPPTQQYWVHAIPKERYSVGERINLTFRYLVV